MSGWIEPRSPASSGHGGPWGCAAVLVVGIALAGCGSEGGSPSTAGPLILAVVAGSEPDVAHGGLPGSAVVQVRDPATRDFISSATVTVNGSTLTYDPHLVAFVGTLQVSPGATVRVGVATAAGSWEARLVQVPAYPVVASPAPGETWSAMRTNALRWSVQGAPAGTTLLPAIFDASGNLDWPGNGLRSLPVTESSVDLPPASLAPGSHVAFVALVSRAPFAGAAAGSELVLEGAGTVRFEAQNGVRVAPAARPAHLQVAGGNVVWSEGGPTTVKSAPSAGGQVKTIVQWFPMPETVHAAGMSLYFISGNQLLRSALDGTGVEVLATGLRAGTPPGTTDLVVDATSVYWVNSTNTGTWSIVRTPLAGGPSTTFASTPARVIGLAADDVSIYWEQQGGGPVSADGMGPGDSAILAADKQGGAVRRIVNGLQNGPPRVVPPGEIPGNWFGTGGIVVAGGYLAFADTDFSGSYRLLRVATAGGPLTVLQSATVGGVAGYVRRISTDGTTLFWIDGISVNSVPLEGGAATQIAGGILDVVSLAVAGGRVVWTENVCCSVHESGVVRTVPTSGGSVQTLATLRDNPGEVATDGLEAFWSEGGARGNVEGYGGIAHVPVAGGTAEMLLSTLFTPRPPIATDGTNVFIADGWRVKSAPLGGGPLEPAIVGFWSMVATATDGQSVFGLDAQGNVLSAPVGGGAPTMLAPGLFGPAAHLVHAAGYLYWVDRGDTLRRVPTGGGPVETLATSLPSLSGLVADASFVYLSQATMGVVLKLPATGGVPTMLVDGLDFGPVAMVLAGQELYWIGPGRIGRVELATGQSTLLARGIATDPDVPASIAIDDSALYWTETRTGEVRRSVDR